MVGRDSVEPKRNVTICGPVRLSLALPKRRRLGDRRSLGFTENARIIENISNAGPVPLSNQTG